MGGGGDPGIALVGVLDGSGVAVPHRSQAEVALARLKGRTTSEIPSLSPTREAEGSGGCTAAVVDDEGQAGGQAVGGMAAGDGEGGVVPNGGDFDGEESEARKRQKLSP